MLRFQNANQRIITICEPCPDYIILQWNKRIWLFIWRYKCERGCGRRWAGKRGGKSVCVRERVSEWRSRERTTVPTRIVTNLGGARVTIPILCISYITRNYYYPNDILYVLLNIFTWAYWTAPTVYLRKAIILRGIELIFDILGVLFIFSLSLLLLPQAAEKRRCPSTAAFKKMFGITDRWYNTTLIKQLTVCCG
jgi:hypothetical protein